MKLFQLFTGCASVPAESEGRNARKTNASPPVKTGAQSTMSLPEISQSLGMTGVALPDRARKVTRKGRRRATVDLFEPAPIVPQRQNPAPTPTAVVPEPKHESKTHRRLAQLKIRVPKSRKRSVITAPRPVMASPPKPQRQLVLLPTKKHKYRCKRCRRIFRTEINARAHYFCKVHSG